jgi:hypothetical protein
MVILTVIAAVLLGGGSGSASDSDGSPGHRFVSTRFGFSVRLPSGWHRSTQRLVPLIDPREILSAGTFTMSVGGGGNCGREPTAAIERMRPGDAMVSIQEFPLSAHMRSHLARSEPPLTSYLGDGAEPELQREPRVAGEHLPPSRSLWRVTLPFRDRGRSFDALIYVKGPPSDARLGQIVSILGGLDFKAGDYLRPESAAERRAAA